MTSGSFGTIALTDIVVQREARQRRELKPAQIEELAASLRELGLINPIVITRENVLVAGERRTEAAKSLGWDRIAYQYADQVNHAELHLLELEENTKRVDLDWKDQCRAIEEYHKLRSELDPTWNNEKTAKALGTTAKSISEKVSVANALKTNPRVAAAPKFSVARNIDLRDKERKNSSILAGVRQAPEAPIYNLDFNEWAPTYSGPKFNFIHCDFPYGINMQRSDQGAGAKHGTYDDSPDVYWALLETLKGAMDNVVADSAHLMFWYSMEYYEETRRLLSDMGWRVDPFPLVWFKSDNVGILPDPNRGPRRVYETALFGHRGDRKVVKPAANAVAHPSERLDHMSVKPAGMLRHFFGMIVDENSAVLDPTCGSGSALRAAKSFNPYSLLGLEREPEFARRAAERFTEES